MATTTNFGWTTPNDTDQVKDGALAIRTLGNGIDTSLVDLKGGTTGQILSKASNTDLDYTWIDNQVGDITEVAVSSPITGGGTSGIVTVGIQDGTTAQKGAVQLTDSTSSTSTTTAATPNSVKTAWDLANGAVAKSLIDAKGDLITATANDTPARLAVSTTNGDTLVVDSSTSTGLRWATDWNVGKNQVLNSNFSINQRNFTSTTTTASYGFDRWRITAVDGTTTYSTQAFTLGAAPAAPYEATNFVRLVTTGQTLATAVSTLEQRIESVRTLANQTVTISFWAKANTGTPKIAVELNQNFGSGGSPSAEVNTNAGQVTLSTAWARYSVTVANPSISGKTLGTTAGTDYLELRLYVSAGSNFNARTGTLGIQTNTFEIWGVQLESGSVANAYTPATPNFQTELAACQRYYYRITLPAANTFFNANGLTTASTTSQVSLQFPVVMRIAPTALEQTGTAANYNIFMTNGNTQNLSAVPTFNNASVYGSSINTTVASAQTLGPAMLRASATNAYLGWSAEL